MKFFASLIGKLIVELTSRWPFTLAMFSFLLGIERMVTARLTTSTSLVCSLGE